MNGHVIENNDNIVQTQSIMGRAPNPPWSLLGDQSDEIKNVKITMIHDK